MKLAVNVMPAIVRIDPLSKFFPLITTFFSLKFFTKDVSSFGFFAAILRFSNVKFDKMYLKTFTLPLLSGRPTLKKLPQSGLA